MAPDDRHPTPDDGPAEPIRRRKLSDEVRDRLLELLRGEGMKPGDMLPSERELMTRYGVGRPAVREAMQSLQGMGLIDVRHGERPRVARATVDAALDRIALTMRHTLSHSAPTLEQMKEVRLVTETYLAERAAARADRDALRRIRDVLAEQEAAAGRDADDFVRLDGAFHAAVAEAAGNPVFTATARALFDWLSVFHLAAVHKPGMERLTLQEHRQILACIEAEDGRGARRAMRDHLLRANALYATDNRQA
jgi:DNA-binding FadR family transcriptional regulator